MFYLFLKVWCVGLCSVIVAFPGHTHLLLASFSCKSFQFFNPVFVVAWYALLYIHSSFAIILTRKRAGCFALIVFQMSCYCKCSVALPHCAMGWSAVCNCGIS